MTCVGGTSRAMADFRFGHGKSYRVIPGVGHDMETYRLMSGSGNERLFTEYAIEWFDRYLKPLNQGTE